MESQKHLEDLSEIRNMMERSSRFISLSGLSGVFAGIFALIGAAFAYWYLSIYFPTHKTPLFFKSFSKIDEAYLLLFLDAAFVLIFALSFGIFFTTRKAKRKGLKVWDKTTKRLVINLFVPLIAGGTTILIMILNNNLQYIASLTLIFYGLALLNASHFTLTDIRYLGYCDIGLGLFTAAFEGYDLLCWTIGFGILHIVYGLVMYYKYER